MLRKKSIYVTLASAVVMETALVKEATELLKESLTDEFNLEKLDNCRILLAKIESEHPILRKLEEVRFDGE